MENATYIGLSRLSALRQQMDVLANNLANMNTTGFKGQRVLFEEFLVPIGPNQKASFVLDRASLRDTREGEQKPTGNPLDIAINGKGYLVVETPDGPRYTRNGNLRIDNEGRLVTAGGKPILSDRGQPLRFDVRDGTPTIAKDGTVTSGTGARVGRIDVVTFENEQKMRQAGEGIYATDDQPQPSRDSALIQGMLEGSNIQPIVEMTNMIEIMRSYQSTQRMLDSEQERSRRAIGQLAKVS